MRALKRGGAHQFVSFDEQVPASRSGDASDVSFERRELLRCRMGLQHCDARVEKRARPICCGRQTGMGG